MTASARILLGQRASAHLTAAGGDAFLVVGKSSYPGDPSRWILHLVPCPMDRASAACEVATGKRKPRKRVTAAEAARERDHVDPAGNQAPFVPRVNSAAASQADQAPSLPT